MAATTNHDLSRAPWRKSSFSGVSNNCVEVATVGPLVAVRDTTIRSGALLVFSPAAWQSFAAGLRSSS